MTPTAQPTLVKCPTCKRTVPWVPEELFKPFCSERCKLIDLGEWVMEEKRIPGEQLIGLESDDDTPFWQ
ncbi:MAG: DNA gyrase inhibitor YacG [Methylovulum sp.]|nr:DNA gyrase inhibitor YacG [Methylovulum sp.]